MSSFQRLCNEFFEFWWRQYPTHATSVGIHDYDRELERWDDATLAERTRAFRAFLSRIEASAVCDPGEALDRELLANQVRWELLELERFRTYTRNPAVYLDSVFNALYLMAVREYAPAADRAACVVERLERLPRVLEEARRHLVAPAAVLVRTAAAIARSGVQLLQGVLPLHLGRALEADERSFSAWEAARRRAADALVAYADWLENEVGPRATADFAVGLEAFEARTRLLHGLEFRADELYEFGIALKGETERELAAVAARIGSASWRELAEEAKREHPPLDGLIDAYAREMARAREFVLDRGLVTMPEGESLDVVATPEYLRPIIPYAAYLPPAAHEAEQRGLFFVTAPDPENAREALRDHALHGIVVTALHEAYPGHHLQLTRANGAATEPRRVFWTSVFAEGWALYCEEMMWEQGFYTDLRQRLLQLTDLLWRACRVVVDVGLHVRGWSYEEAVEYMVREAGLERANAEVEVRRYCGEPTQPMSYAVGKREILRLRERARAERGDAFDLRAFHDELLSWGTIPPPLVGRAMGLR